MGRFAGVAILGLMIVIAGLLPTPALAQTRYVCRGGATVFVDYGGQHAELTFLGVRYFLPQVPLAEGSRYSDGRFTWTVTRAQEGTLTHDGAVIASECRTGFFSQPGVPTLPGGQTVYTCASGGAVTATYSGSTALVTFRGRTHRLEQVPLFEGSRYTDGRFTWTVSRAQEGTLTRDGAVIASECRTGFASLPGGPTIPGGPTLPGGFAQTIYTCAGGGSVVASYGPSTAIVTFQGNTYRLVQVPLAAGSRYTDGRLTWTVAGDVGTLTRDGGVLVHDCRAGVASQPGSATYTCAAGGPVIATYSGSTAIVTFQGNTYRLVQVPLGEGTRYTDGRFTWTVNRGDEGTLTYFGTVVANGCRNATFQPREPER